MTTVDHDVLAALPIMTDEGFCAQPLTPWCADAFTATSHVVIGVSPFNSYFRTERIVELIDWARVHFDEDGIAFFTPDMAAAYTLQAQGYDEAKALKKARHQAKYVHNKIHAAIDDAELDGHERVMGMQDLRENARYNELRGEAADRFESDPQMRADIMGTSSWILAGKLEPGVSPTPEQVRLAVEYFLDELPLFVDSPGIFGVERSCFIYHQRVEFLEKFFAGQMDWKPAAGQSFCVVQPESECDFLIDVR